MSEREEVYLDDVDPMLFMQAVIDDGLEFLATLDEGPAMFPGVGPLIAGVADIQREKLDEAQGYLDQMIEEDKTWRPV